eukprot:2639623-Prymnesium_polylepis.2
MTLQMWERCLHYGTRRRKLAERRTDNTSAHGAQAKLVASMKTWLVARTAQADPPVHCLWLLFGCGGGRLLFGCGGGEKRKDVLADVAS